MQLIIFIVESSTFYRGVTIIRVFPLHCRMKRFLPFPNICTCSLQFLTKQELNVSQLNTSHENKQLSTWSNICWLIHKKHWSWRCFHFSYYLVFHIFRQIWSAPLINITEKRFSSHVGLTSFSKKKFLCFQQIGFTSVFTNGVSFFAWQFQVRLLVETSGKISLWCFKLASWRRKNSITFCGVIRMVCL